MLENSRQKTALLHKCFEWNDSLAAEKYRKAKRERLSEILLWLTLVNQKIKLPLERLSTLQKNEQKCFVSVKTALQDLEMRDEVLRNAISELSAFKQKYQNLKQLSKVLSAIDEVTEAI